MKKFIVLLAVFWIGTLHTAEAQECAPYVCNDGTVYAACSADGYPLQYFAAPCHANGGIRSAAGIFSDVSETHPAYAAIEWAYSNGIVQGYNDGTFGPDRLINRAEFVKVLLQGAVEVCRLPLLSDIDTNAWFAPFIRTAMCTGLVQGYSDGTFRPSVNINAAEAAKIIVMQHSQNGVIAAATNWYEPFISYLVKRQAYPSSITSPSAYITRAEMVHILYQLHLVTTGSSTSSVPTENVLLEVKNAGGLCVYGGCESTYTFMTDGTVLWKSNKVTKTMKLPAEQVSTLQTLLAQANVPYIYSRPFTGTCPRAYDATAFIYTWFATGVSVTIDACQYMTDDILFQTIDGIVAQFDV